MFVALTLESTLRVDVCRSIYALDGRSLFVLIAHLSGLIHIPTHPYCLLSSCDITASVDGTDRTDVSCRLRR